MKIVSNAHNKAFLEKSIVTEQEELRILWKLSVHDRFQKSPQVGTTLCLIEDVYSLKLIIFNIHFNIIFFCSPRFTFRFMTLN
jgi:hypothetical protein